MGKNRIIKSLGNIIGKIVVHKILVNYTNKPESVNHLSGEIGAYMDNAIETAQEFNWNEKDKSKIKQDALKKFKKDMERYYPDVKFPSDGIDEIIDKTIAECGI
jgi:hypothetical protein